MLYEKKATMRFLIVLLFCIMNVVGSAQVPKKGALSGYIAKLEKEIADAKMYQADSARIAELEKILAQMKFTQAYLDKGVAKKQKPKTKAGVRWTGTMTRDIVTVHSNELYQGKITEKIVVNFINTYPTMNREDQDPDSVYKNDQDDTLFADNKGTGTYGLKGSLTNVIINQTCVSDCNGSGPSELHSVSVREFDNTYDIEAIGPDYHCTHSCKEPVDEYGKEITVSNHALTNKNLLEGTRSVTSELPGKMGTVTSTTTWRLEREIPEDILIVTPEDYDTWLPEPGKDENSPGRMIVINLKVVGKNGQPPNSDVKSFEVRLKNTSREPGICLNMPLTVGPVLPDLRFNDEFPWVQTSGERQVATIESLDGTTGSIFLDPFDGGGYTTLTATATMEDGSKLVGQLLVSGGKTEIPIPKRPPGSHIGDAWLAKYKNPADTDDKETSPGNSYDGDGLSAYEEYRGVIAHGGFERLDPNKKELGVKTGDWLLFLDGIAKFEAYSGVDVICFFENEIGPDRRLNKNKLTAHIYDQYALYLQKAALTGDLGKSFGGPAIPKQVSKTVIDQNRIRLAYQDRLAEAKSINATLSYTEKDLFATVTAHELSHSVNVKHHGSLAPNSLNVQIQPGRPVRIFDYNGSEILTRPYHITGRGGDTGNEQSGDVDCFMLNNALCDWAVRTAPDSMFFYQVPLIPLGTKLCNKKNGTGLNSLKDANGNYKYFGDAANGNCLSQIKLK